MHSINGDQIFDEFLCREESEKVSELKNVSSSGKLPYGSLANGTEGIKESIQGFDDA